MAGARTVRRQEYRKAGSRFQVEVSQDLDLLDQLHGRTFERQGLVRSDHEQRQLRAIAGAALEHGFGELLVAFDTDGVAAGAVLFLFDTHSAYYLVAANDPDYRSAGVSTLLFLRGTERAMERGLSALDVVGLNSPSRGDFKTSFGAVPVPYYVATWERP
ncbi:MAG: GNAT family N-acetyltransferase [Gemmatimonadales bacterium]